MQFRSFPILLILVVSVALTAGANWPRFRGPGGSGVSDDTGLPTSWGPEESIVWQTPLPGFGTSSPITLGDKIFLTCYSGYGLDQDEPGDQEDLLHHVVCLDRTTGKILWDKRSWALLPEQDYSGFMALHGYASGTPVTDGQRVYVFFGRSGAWAYGLDGELLWKKSVGKKTHGWGSATSPILHDDLVIINASVESQSIVALDKATGKEAWRTEGVIESWSTPVIVATPEGSRELVVSMKNEAWGLDPKTGEKLWRCESVQDYVCPSVIAQDGIAYITSGRTPLTIAVRAGGRGDVTATHRLWELRETPRVPSPLVHDGLLYWVCDRGIACCVDAATGEMVYEKRIPRFGKTYASVVLADGKLFAVSRENGAVVLAAGREFKLLAQNKLDDDSIFNATPVVSRSQLLLRSDRMLYCIGKK